MVLVHPWDGFLQPINDTAHDQHLASPISKFKLGQTIPVKFDLKDANGNIVVQAGSPLFNRGLVSTGCGVATEDEPATSLPADSMPIYTLNGGHYQYRLEHEGARGGSVSHLREPCGRDLSVGVDLSQQVRRDSRFASLRPAGGSA